MQEGRDPKLGFVATEVGALLEFRIDSAATTSAGGKVPLRLSYLASYEHMGKARALLHRCDVASRTPPATPLPLHATLSPLHGNDRAPVRTRQCARAS